MTRQPSKEDLELTESLHLLTQARDRFNNNIDPHLHAATTGFEQIASTSNGTSGEAAGVPGIQSLEDTMAYQHNASDQAPSPNQESKAQKATRKTQVNNAPILGQVCR